MWHRWWARWRCGPAGFAGGMGPIAGRRHGWRWASSSRSVITVYTGYNPPDQSFCYRLTGRLDTAKRIWPNRDGCAIKFWSCAASGNKLFDVGGRTFITVSQ